MVLMKLLKRYWERTGSGLAAARQICATANPAVTEQSWTRLPDRSDPLCGVIRRHRPGLLPARWVTESLVACVEVPQRRPAPDPRHSGTRLVGVSD
jgi:hypothetical protein